MIDEASLMIIMKEVEKNRFGFDNFRNNVVYFFEHHPQLNGSPPVVHTVKSRLKDPQHIREKILRKSAAENPITLDNVFDRITDIAGVRVLHLYQEQFSQIHQAINKQIEDQEWILSEKPKAYTWDPESKEFFSRQNLSVDVKESFYTSIHYVIKPRIDSPFSCEIQVRTLFEEIWGEIDHHLNYPNPTESVSCREQIRVLARLVGAGSRLADSIFRTHFEDMKRKGI
jgi:putative GTP pyrophosphokinase